MASPSSAEALLRRAWSECDGDPALLELVGDLPNVPLPARLDVSSLAAASVAAAALAGATFTGERMPLPPLSPTRIAAAFTSERAFRLNGEAPQIWGELSGFSRTRDGWVRIHANYPHHDRALRRALSLGTGATRSDLERALEQRGAHEVAERIRAAGGVCVEVRPADAATDAALMRHPLIDSRLNGTTRVASWSDAARPVATSHDAPLAGVRVLDLTRVIAGPVATRVLAQFGADVLRIDPPSPPEIAWQHLETGQGKRSALLDLRTDGGRAIFEALCTEADCVVLGYRPDALIDLGISAEVLGERFPGLVIGEVSAWGAHTALGGGRGFDSIVQAESGIALLEGDAGVPGALPAQALDHASGYFLAAGLIRALSDRRIDGRGRTVSVALRRTAAELLRMPRQVETAHRAPALGDHARFVETEEHHTGAGAVRMVGPALAAREWIAPPRPWGSDLASFL